MAGAQATILDHEVGTSAWWSSMVEGVWVSDNDSSTELSLDFTPPDIVHKRKMN
jgi:hypothetical protein